MAPPRRQEETPLPLAKVAIVAIIVFSNAVSLMCTTPYVPFMVKDFFPDYTRSQIGYFSGFLEASFHFGSLLGSPCWGMLADQFGRRPALLAGLCGTIFASLLFGFSQSFAMAVIARFLWGLLNGNVGVAKTYLAEICDSSNQSRGFATMGVIGAFGRLLGPVTGGLLSRPAEQYAFFQDWPGHVWEAFPYALPPLLTSSFTLLCFVSGWCLLTETLPADRVDPRNPFRVLCMKLSCGYCRSADSRYEQVRNDDDVDEANGDETAAAARAPSGWEGILMTLREPPMRTAVLLYGSLSFTIMGANELLPLFALNDPEHGGFSFESRDIGLILTAIGPVLLVYQLVGYHRIVKRFGLLRSLQGGLLVLSLFLFLTPWSSLVESQPRAWHWAALLAVVIPTILCRATCFVNTFQIINNVGDSRTRGVVNGVGQSSSSLGRILAPPFYSSLFAWSASYNGPWPMNYHLAWYATAVSALCVIGVVRSLPASAEFKAEDLAANGGSGREEEETDDLVLLTEETSSDDGDQYGQKVPQDPEANNMGDSGDDDGDTSLTLEVEMAPMNSQCEPNRATG